MLLNKKDFDILTGKIKDYSGIMIAADKEYLLESRLMPVVRKYGLDELASLVGYMQENKDEALLIEIIESITTNESFFFRDFKPFEFLRDKILPEFFVKHPEKNRFRIWSAASSTGQEAYSIAMNILESSLCAGKKFEIIATDIDMNVIKKAREGAYSQFEVQRGVPINLLLKYFTKEGDRWYIKDNVKQMVAFDKFNLLEQADKLGMFDIIFCRNVLIYFDEATKEKVLKNLAKTMYTHAKLFTGCSESLVGLNVPFQSIEGMYGVFELK